MAVSCPSGRELLIESGWGMISPPASFCLYLLNKCEIYDNIKINPRVMRKQVAVLTTTEQIDQKHQEDLQRLRGFRLLDDDFLTKCFDGDPKYIQICSPNCDGEAGPEG